MANTNNKVSLAQIIGNVCGNLDIQNVNGSIDDFARWALEAEMKIGSVGSTERFECEIEVHNRRACLPENFVKLNALKYGAELIDVTFKDFRMFSNAPRDTSQDIDKTFNAGNYQTSIPGQIQSMRITFSGVYASGDVLTVTINGTDCGVVSTNTFTYIVQPGDGLSDIATALAGEINAIFGTGYSAVASGYYLDITGSNVNIAFNVTTYTNSTLGRMTVTTIQPHVAPRIIENKVNDVCDSDPELGSENLSNLNSFEINTGVSRNNNNGSINSYSYQFGPVPNAKVYTIENGYIFVNFIEEGKLGLSYLGLCLDDDGWPLIDFHHEDAVTHYCMYMYKAREYYANKLPHHVFKEMQNRWFYLCGQARGRSALPSRPEMDYLSNLWNQLLPIANRNFF
jgi:hypothetical protein